jgi:hypothetical protein
MGYGYMCLLLSEYHLLTEDERVLPAIEAYATAIAEGQSGVGSWGHGFAWPDQPMNRGRKHHALGGYGAVNQAGNVCWISLMLAKRCGVKNQEIDDAISRGHRYLDKYVDLKTIGYGDDLVFHSKGHDNNGLNSSAAVGFALFGDKRGTDYYSRMTVASHAVRKEGHTGVWFASIWAAPGAARGGQQGCSAFLHELAWLHDLERRWDGGFQYQGKPGFGCDVYTDGPKKGQQKRNAEHQYAHWDTTGQRILMYCLPRKVLHITGKQLLETSLPSAEVADVIDAGRIPLPQSKRTERYDNYSDDDLLKLLGSWSPVVRTFAGKSLAKKQPVPVDRIVGLFDGESRYAKYGACVALRAAKSRDDKAINGLITQLSSDDLILQLNAALALGFINNKRAARPLLTLAAKDNPGDPQRVMSDVLCVALFQNSPYLEEKGLLAESVEGIDADLLIPALKKLLYCPNGVSRSMLTGPITQLTENQCAQIWPELIYALKEVAPSGIMFATGIRIGVAGVLADNRIAEGPELLMEYLKVRKGHGGEKTLKSIMELLKQYKGTARSILPQLNEYLKELESAKRPNQKMIDAMRETIEFIKASKEEVETVSIKEHLK